MCPSVPSNQSMCQGIWEDFCEVCIEACVDDVSNDNGSLANCLYHVTDS